MNKRDCDSVRDVVEDRIRDVLAEHYKTDRLEVNVDLVATIADEVFSACGISEKEQDEPW